MPIILGASRSSNAESRAPKDLSALTVAIQESESMHTDIVDGAEKHIRWYDKKQVKSKLAFVYIHGFSASRQELSPVTEELADKFSANVFYTRLTGHGRSDDAMAEASTDAWKKDIKDAYNIGRIIGEKVILISTSTGGTLATWLLAQEETEQPFANIMVSPNYAVQSGSAWLFNSSLGLWVAKLINGDYNAFDPISESHAKYWTERYPLEALVPMMSLLSEVESLNKSKVTTPQLIIYSPKDSVIKPEKVIEVSNEFINSDLTLTPFTQSTDPYQHVLAGKACSPESSERMINLLADYVEQLLIK